MTLRIFIPILLIAFCYAQNAPQCANHQKAKEDKNGKIIQCLPGSSQKMICGIDHVCYFTGINYVCCPSNEPTVEHQPSCPKPSLTVLGSDGLPMKCSPRTRTCPSRTMDCTDTGLAYICCENAIGRDPPPLVESTTKSGNALECPANSIGVLNELGHRVICNVKRRCPGRHQFCFGGLKRSICCERYETAKTLSDDQATITKKKNLKMVSLTANAPMNRASLKPVVIESNSFVSSEIGYKPKSISIAMKSSKSRNVESDPTTVDPFASEFNGSFFDSRLAFLEKVHNTQGPLQVKKSTRVQFRNDSELSSKSSFDEAQSASGRSETSTSTATVPIDKVFDNEEHNVSPSSTSSQPKRPRMQAAKTLNAQEGLTLPNNGSSSESSEFAPSPPIPSSQTIPKSERRQLAQTYLIHQIRDGWPYNERFYRPASYNGYVTGNER